MSDAEKASRLYRLSDADGGVRDIVKMTYDDVWAIAVKGGGMSPEQSDKFVKETATLSGIPYEHLCRLASVVREIYRARVEVKS